MEKYYESMLKISHNDIMYAQEEAVLHATVNWAEHTKICCERSDEGLRPVSKERVRMAEVNMQVKMRDMQNKFEQMMLESQENPDKEAMSEFQRLVELYKIEDQIALNHTIETEHILMLKNDYRNKQQEEEQEISTAEESFISQQITEMTKEIDLQPKEMALSLKEGGWNTKQKE